MEAPPPRSRERQQHGSYGTGYFLSFPTFQHVGRSLDSPGTAIRCGRAGCNQEWAACKKIKILPRVESCLTYVEAAHALSRGTFSDVAES